MDTALLRSFLTVANTNSFSMAATRLNITQSTVSHQIARLEEHLGKQLFERTTRTCRLTPEGVELVGYATRVLREVEEMEQAFKPRLLIGTLVLGVPDDYYLFVALTEALREFMAARPGIAVEMRAGLSADHARSLREHNLDLAVLREIGQGPDDVLRTERMVWIRSPTWDFPADGILPLASVGGNCVYKRAATTILDQRGIRWRSQFSCTSLEGVLAVVRAGLAISAVTEGDSRSKHITARREDFLPTLPVTSLTIRHADDEPSLAAKALARTLAEALATAGETVTPKRRQAASARIEKIN